MFSNALSFEEKVFKKMMLKWPKSCENLKKITELNFQNWGVFVGQKLILSHYCIQSVKDRIQIKVYKISRESVTCFCQFVPVKVKKILRKSQAHFQKV